MRRFFMAAGLGLAVLGCPMLASADAPGCTFENRAYFDGQVVCQYGSLMKCAAGSWVDTGDECANEDSDEGTGQPNAAGPGDVQMPAAPQAPAEPAVPPVTE